MKIGADNNPENLVTEEEAKITEERKQDDISPRTLTEKFENFWYFYKWHTIIIGIVLIGIIVSAFQFAGNDDPDAYIMYVGPSTLYVKNKDKMSEIAEEYMEDCNEDGKKYLSILEITVAVGDDIPYTAYQTNVDAMKRFTTEVTVGESLIYLVEESFYEKLLEQNILAKISEVIDTDDIPEYMYDEYGVRVGELDWFKQSGYSAITDEIILCIRQSPDNDSISYGRSLAYWNSNKKLFKAMFSYRLPESEKQDEKKIKALDRGKTDLAILYVGQDKIYESTSKILSTAAKKYIPDTNNDTKFDLTFGYSLTGKPGGKQWENARKYVEYQINNDSCFLYIVDEDTYNFLKGIKEGLKPLNEMFTEADMYFESFDEYGIKLGSLDFFKDIPYWSSLDKSLIICVGEGEDGDENYSSSVSFLKNIVFYRTNIK